MNTLRNFIKFVLKESGNEEGITRVPGGISRNLTRSFDFIESNSLPEKTQIAMAAADKFLSANQDTILRDVSTAIDENSIEVGVKVDPEDQLSRARAISSLLVKDKTSDYPYRTGLYIAAWKNGWQDASWVAESFQDNLGRIPNAAKGVAKKIEDEIEADRPQTPGLKNENRRIREGVGIAAAAVTAGHLMAHYLYPAIRKYVPVAGIKINATKWILSEAETWVDTFVKFKEGATDLSGFQFVKTWITDQLVLRTIGKDFPTMRSASKICFDAFSMFDTVPGPVRKNIFGGSESSPFAQAAVQTSFLRRTQEILFEMTKQDTIVPTGDAFFDLLTTSAKGDSTTSTAYTRLAAIARAFKANQGTPTDKFKVALPGGAKEFTRSEGQIAYDFFMKYSSGVEKMVGVFRYLRLPAQILTAAGLALTVWAIHAVSDYLYVSTFVGADHLPVDISDEKLAALFTAATVRETCHDALSAVINDTDYETYSLDDLQKADETLLDLLARPMTSPTSGDDMAKIAILYDKAVIKLEAL